MSWSVKAVGVFIGRLLTPEGEVLKNALILNAEGLALSDDNGFFQAELDIKTDALQVRKNGKVCMAQLPSFTPNDQQVYFLDEMTCQ